MTFDEWCESKQIRGDWKEALTHELDISDMEHDKKDTEEGWIEAWNSLLNRLTKNIPKF